MTSMHTKKLVRYSKRLSWLLRFGATEAGVPMDEAGWVAVADVLAYLRMSADTLTTVVRTNNKSRLQLDSGRVRACQGHGLDDVPVTREALESSWAVFDGPGPVYHGTHVAAARAIAREGILPGSRTHVHLAEALDSRVGKRANVGVMLQVSPTRLRARGREVFVSPNGVVLVRDVPTVCVTDIIPRNRHGHAAADELRRAFSCRG